MADGEPLFDTGPTPDGDLGWWLYVGETTGSMDAVPAHDIRQHVSGEGCWCLPLLGDDHIVRHNSADGREHYEMGRKRH